MKTALATTVIALALFAGRLTPAAADELAAADATSAPTSTPLHTRPSTPLEPAPARSGGGWKLLAFAGVAAGALWVWKRRLAPAAVARGTDLTIVRRTGLGVRSELVLIDIEGQRLLLGVTPHAIQTLYIVPDSPMDDRVSEPASADSTFARRLAGMLDAREPHGSPARGARAGGESPSVLSMIGDGDIEEQARGLARLGERQ